MRLSYFIGIIGIAFSIMLLASCGGNKKQFQPKERTSSMSDQDRTKAIASKKNDLSASLDTLLYSHGVKFSIIKPTLQGDITERVSDAMALKMLEIASQNGISGLGVSPGFVMGVEISQTDRSATGTAPQKMSVSYNLTFKVMNVSTGDVYATASQQVTGVGRSFAEASLNAAASIKNTTQMQKMLQTASERIIAWYNGNLQAVKNQVEKAVGEGNYDLAIAILSSVPEQAKAAYQWASGKLPQVNKAMQHRHAAEMLSQLEGAIASAGDDYSPTVGAYLQLIPSDTPEHAKALSAYAAYEKKCEAHRIALEARAERDAQAERELKKWEGQKEHEKELAQIEADKITAKYAAKANAAATERAMRYESDQRHKGFFGKLGDRILGGFDFIGEKITEHGEEND